MINTEFTSRIDMYRKTVPTKGTLYSRIEYLIRNDRSLKNKEIQKILGCKLSSVSIYASKIRKELDEKNDTTNPEEKANVSSEVNEIHVQTPQTVSSSEEDEPIYPETIDTEEPVLEPLLEDKEKSSPDAYSVALKNTSPKIIEYIFTDLLKYLDSDFNYDFEITITKSNKNY